MDFRTAFVSCVVVLVCCACVSERTNQPYHFFVAGHTYGEPDDYVSGMYHPFREFMFELSRIEHQYEFGVLTGDVVPRGDTVKYWIAARSVIDTLDIPIHIIPGNHDIIDPNLFEQYAGVRYQSFLHGQDLFMLLDGNEGWNIKGEQLKFFRDAMDNHEGRVFIFVHQLIWWQPTGPFSGMTPNWTEGRADRVNFHDEIMPLLQQRSAPVYLFAGDVGAIRSNQNLYYEQHENVHLIASGMGNGRQDHLLDVHVNDHEVNIWVLSLPDDAEPVLIKEAVGYEQQ